MDKKFLLLFVLPVLCFNNVKAQTFYQQYFDGADTSASNSVLIEILPDSTNIWQVGKPNKTIFNGAATVPNAIVTDTINFYPVNNTSSFKATIITSWFTPWGIFALQWKQKLDMDQNTDGALIEFSYDNGATWYNAFNNPYVYNFYGFQPSNQDTLPGGQACFSGTDTTWRDIWLCMDKSWMSSMGDTIDFRFTLQTDSIHNNKEGWLIDNMLAHITWVHTVGEIKSDKYFNVYPNPANDLIHIDTKKLREFHLIETMELISANGQVVERWSNIPTRFFIDTRKYTNGTYTLKIKTNKHQETFPMVINHL